MQCNALRVHLRRALGARSSLPSSPSSSFFRPKYSLQLVLNYSQVSPYPTLTQRTYTRTTKMPAHIESFAVEHGVEPFSSQSIPDSTPKSDCGPTFKKRKLSPSIFTQDGAQDHGDMDTDTDANVPFAFDSESRIPDLDHFSSGPSSAATSDYSDSEEGENDTDISSLAATANSEVDAEMAVPAVAPITKAAVPRKPQMDMSAQFRVKRLSDRARVPTRGSAKAAGYDLYRYVHTCIHITTPYATNTHNTITQFHSAEKKIIPARGKALVDTQLSIAVPEGTYGRVAPRSGLGMS